MSDILQHYGIRGMKWGVRRFQQKDGSWTPQGRKRYGGEDRTERKKLPAAGNLGRKRGPWGRRQPQESFSPLIW